MTLLVSALERLPLTLLVRLACLCSLLSVGLFSWAAVVDRALPIILGMSLGHGAGLLGLLLFLSSVLADGLLKRLSPASDQGDG